ncbi:hypothetical protein HYX19_01525 [Candidatus Woesearchaeota archaeon]|nr:hypothetical protein [Candidatus Woesearchaeota archaeon]
MKKSITGLAMILALSGCARSETVAPVTINQSEEGERKVDLPDLCKKGKVISAGYAATSYIWNKRIPWVSCEDERRNVHIYRLEGNKWYGIHFEKK